MPVFIKIQASFEISFRTKAVEADLDDEVHSHLEMLVDENVHAGLPLDEARRAARIELGASTG